MPLRRDPLDPLFQDPSREREVLIALLRDAGFERNHLGDRYEDLLTLLGAAKAQGRREIIDLVRNLCLGLCEVFGLSLLDLVTLAKQGRGTSPGTRDH